MWYFLFGFIIGCITGYFSNKQINIQITYNKSKKKEK